MRAYRYVYGLLLLHRPQGPAVDGLGFCVHVAPIIVPGNRFYTCVRAFADKDRVVVVTSGIVAR